MYRYYIGNSAQLSSLSIKKKQSELLGNVCHVISRKSLVDTNFKHLRTHTLLYIYMTRLFLLFPTSMTRKYITTYNSCKSLNKQTSVTDLLLDFRINYLVW